MIRNNITPKELWSRQHICSLSTDYDRWDGKRESIKQFSKLSQSCIFTVDVFKERYDFASDNFSTFFGYNPEWIKTIRRQGDVREEYLYHQDSYHLIIPVSLSFRLIVLSIPRYLRPLLSRHVIFKLTRLQLLLL